MRGKTATVLIVLGMTFVLLAVMLKVYAQPRLAKAPIDQYSQTVAVGTGTYFSFATLSVVEDTTLRSTTTTRADQAVSDSKVAVYDQFSVIEDTGAAQGVVTASTARIPFDRQTGEPVDCCEASAAFEGFSVKFPFGTEPRDYLWWDGTVGQALPVTYAGEEDLDGLPVYRFVQTVEPTVIETLEVPPGLIGASGDDPVQVNRVYANEKYFLVEPVTGAIIDGGQQVLQTVQTLDGEDVLTFADFDLALDDATLADNIATGKTLSSLLRLVDSTLPIGLSVLGLLMLVAGITMKARVPELEAPMAPAHV